MVRRNQVSPHRQDLVMPTPEWRTAEQPGVALVTVRARNLARC
jgi:hypothetical protein